MQSIVKLWRRLRNGWARKTPQDIAADLFDAMPNEAYMKIANQPYEPVLDQKCLIYALLKHQHGNSIAATAFALSTLIRDARDISTTEKKRR